MGETIYKPSTYHIKANGKEFKGNVGDVTNANIEKVFEGLDKNSIFAIAMLGSVKYKIYDDGRWKNSFGGNWVTPPLPQKYTVIGNQVTMYDTQGKVSATFVLNADGSATTSKEAGDLAFSLTYVVEE
jgi:hypothetical protein